MKYILLAAALAAVLGFAGAFIAAPFYANDFEVDDSANWTINKGPATTDEAHNFFFDYSTVGVPAAPSGAGTRGLKLQANQSSGVFGGVSASPTGMNFSGPTKLTFDWWANFSTAPLRPAAAARHSCRRLD